MLHLLQKIGKNRYKMNKIESKSQSKQLNFRILNEIKKNIKKNKQINHQKKNAILLGGKRSPKRYRVKMNQVAVCWVYFQFINYVLDYLLLFYFIST